jgi:glycosyltransferase involved in cell wall biosynthesis
MHILNIMQCTSGGGMGQASLKLMQTLQARGHSLQVLSLNPLEDLAPLLAESGIAAEGIPYRGRGGWRSLPALRQKLRAVQADALIMTGHHLLTMLALGRLCAGRRLLAAHYHHQGVKPPLQWQLIYRVAEKTFQAITFPSDFVRKEAETLYPPIARISHTVRNPLPTPELPTAAARAAARQAFGLPLHAKVVGNAGWLIQRKRFDVFLHVVKKLADRTPDLCAIIAGDGPERANLEDLARRLQVENRIRWLGWQHDLSPFYHAVDVLLFNSDWDAMPMTPVEAMSYAVPVVASLENGGLEEILGDQTCGLFFRTHDIDGLSWAVATVLNQPSATIAMNGRERAAEFFDVERHVDSIEKLLTLRV